MDRRENITRQVAPVDRSVQAVKGYVDAGEKASGVRFKCNRDFSNVIAAWANANPSSQVQRPTESHGVAWGQ